MSNVTRKGLQFLVNQIGKAKYAFKDLVGDNVLNRGLIQKMDNLAVKIRGSKYFNDYDLSNKDIFGINESTFATYDSSDNLNFTLQGGDLKIDKKISQFYKTTPWTPYNYPVPCLEGWNVYDYNAWSNYVPFYNSSGIANTNLIIYNPFAEPSPGTARTNYNYPVRYNGSAYTRVPLFNNARWISFFNDTGHTVNEVNFIISKDKFLDSFNVDPNSGIPLDLAIYSHKYLVTNTLDETSFLAGNMGVLNESDIFEPLAFEINEVDKNGNSTEFLDHYEFKVRLPSLMTFSNNYWCHIAVYWGTFDDYYKTGYPTYSSGTSEAYFVNELENRWFIFPKVSYFRKEVLNYTAFEKSGVNDLNVYLYSGNKTFFQKIDGQYIEQAVPFRYRLDDNIAYSGSGISSNINFDVGDFEYIPLIVASKNNSLKYDDPKIQYYVFSSSPVPSNEIPSDWKDYNLYPTLDEDYDVIAKIVVTKSSSANYDTPSPIQNLSFISNKVSIVYLERVVDNSIKAPLGDEDVFFYFYNALVADSNSFKNVFFDNILDTLNFALSLPASRINTSNIKTPFVLKNTNQNYYLQFHNLLKYPTDPLLSSSSDPKAIQFEKNGLKSLSDWNAISPSYDFAYVNTSNSYISELKLNLDNEFEIYQEYTDNYNISDVNDAGTKLGKDYSFKISFEDTTFSYLTKEFFVNSTKYLLTDSEYTLRINQNLPMSGYFKKGTYSEQQNLSTGVLETIDDYRIYGYSKVIPDLEMGVSRTILTQEVEPVDSKKITRDGYISQLKTTNSNITEDQINLSIENYLLTSSFYEPNSNKYSNKFAEIKSLGITVSNYSSSSSKWMDNTEVLVGQRNRSSYKDAEHFLDLRYDSFLIANSGYSLEDNTINNLENFGDYKLVVNGTSGIGQSIQNGSKKITTNKLALKISPQSIVDISSFRIKLFNTAIFNNSSAYAKCELWDSFSGLPNTILASGTKVFLSDVINTYDDYEFNLSYKFHENREYWVVLDFNNLPPQYDKTITGKIDINDNLITGALDRATGLYPDFTKYQSGSELGIGSTIPSNIAAWYEISSIGSSSSMTVSGTGQTIFGQDYAVRYNFDMGILESSIATTTPYNIATFTSSGWALTQGTAYIQFYKPDETIYGGFNKDFANNTNLLPTPNKYRESGSNYVDDFWSWNIEKISLPNSIYIYPRSVKLEQIVVPGFGTSTRSYFEIANENWNSKIIAGLAATTTFDYLTSGTAITGIGYSSTSDTYIVHINQPVPLDFSRNVFIGSIGSTYFGRSEDINVKIRYLKNGTIQDATFELPHSPTWNTYLYAKNHHTYTHLDKTKVSDIKKSTHNLNIYNFDVNGTQSYLNGYSKINLTQKSGIGTSFDFRFSSSGGLRVYLNGNTYPDIDNWKTNGSTATCTYDSIGAFDIEVQFWNKTNLPYVTGEWRISGSGNSWQNIDGSFYEDTTIQPVLIDNDIQQISYLTVSNLAADLDTQTMGMPPGDRFVFRSK